MNWNTFLSQNGPTLIGFLGVLVGAIIGVIPSIWMQYRQRRWLLDDQRRQWKRECIQEHAKPIKTWVDVCLQTAFSFARYKEEGATNAWGDNWGKTYHEQHLASYSQAANIQPHLSSLNDELADNLFGEFVDIYASIWEKLEKVDDKRKEITLWVRKLGSIASKLSFRIESLLEDTFTSGRSKEK